VLLGPFTDQPQVRLVDQGGRLQRLTGRRVRYPVGRQFAQFVVDQREQLTCRLLVALLDGVQHLAYLAHRPLSLGATFKEKYSSIRATSHW
jgi:hypothetical protein